MTGEKGVIMSDRQNLPNMRKPIIILNALLNGQTVKLGDEEYRLFRPGEVIPTPSFDGESEQHWIGVKVATEKEDDRYIGVDISLTQFLDLANVMPIEEVATIMANKVLTDINQRRNCETCVNRQGFYRSPACRTCPGPDRPNYRSRT
jgi:hypothetical protein